MCVSTMLLASRSCCWERPVAVATATSGVNQNFASPSGCATCTWMRVSSREKKNSRNCPSRTTVAMQPLVVDIQATIGEKIIAPPMESEISTFNGDIATTVGPIASTVADCELRETPEKHQFEPTASWLRVMALRPGVRLRSGWFANN